MKNKILRIKTGVLLFFCLLIVSGLFVTTCIQLINARMELNLQIERNTNLDRYLVSLEAEKRDILENCNGVRD